MKLHKYYSILRPVMPGGYPNHDVVQVVNFDDRMYCEDIGEKAWGYILFQVPLAEKEVDAYELVSAEQKKYYAVTSAVYDDGRATMKITDSVRAVKKPENTSKSLARKDIYVDWFESKKDAEDFIKENRGVERMIKGKSLSLLRAWVDDHTFGTFSCDREYSWDATGGVITFHEGRFDGLRINFEDGRYRVTGCDRKRELNGVYGSQKDVINIVLIPLCNYAYKEVK